MPIYNRNDPNNWYNTIPIRGQETGYNPVTDPEFSTGKLQKETGKTWFKSGEVIFVQVPVLGNRIHETKNPETGETEIELTTVPATDSVPETRVPIGMRWKSFLPGMMQIYDEYRNYFDLDGNLTDPGIISQLKQEAEKQQEEAEKKKQEQTQNQTKEPPQLQAPEGDTRAVDELIASLLQKRKERDEKQLIADEDPEETETDGEDETDETDKKEQRRVHLLAEILGDFVRMISEQSKRRPDTLMRLTQIRTINDVLREIRELLKDSDAFNFLHLAEEPREDDLAHHPGTTYGEMDILLLPYSNALSEYRSGHYYF